MSKDNKWYYDQADETHNYEVYSDTRYKLVKGFITDQSNLYHAFIYDSDHQDADEEGWFKLNSFLNFQDAKEAIENYRSDMWRDC